MSVTVTVNHADLKSALTFTSLGLSTRPVVPVLSAVRVNAGPAGLQLGAFDYETHATVTVAGDTAYADTAGTLVYGTELTAAVGSLPTGKGTDRVTVTVTDDGLTLLCDGWAAPVTALPAEASAEYPAYPALPPLTGTIDSAVFTRSATRTAACASADDTLPVLTHVHMTAAGGTLTMAATDRYRLAMDEQPCAVATEGVNLVPAGLLVKFAKACDKAGKVNVHLGGNLSGEHVALSDGTRTLITRAGTGEFIRYRKMLDGNTYPTSVTADAATLVKVINRAAKVTGKGERMGFDAGESGVTLTAVRGGKVTGTQTVTATVTGPPVETGFNPVYLASVLSGITGDAVIGLQENVQKPARVTSDDGFTAIVVPVRVPEESAFSKAVAA